MTQAWYDDADGDDAGDSVDLAAAADAADYVVAGDGGGALGRCCY